ncbi:MAG: InlB B-repeat-containing protein [Lachnospiraceae bacterium]|nr:InlB B-repeat-containing protein [Lachnospiraceae bacterium]
MKRELPGSIKRILTAGLILALTMSFSPSYVEGAAGNPYEEYKGAQISGTDSAGVSETQNGSSVRSVTAVKSASKSSLNVGAAGAASVVGQTPAAGASAAGNVPASAGLTGAGSASSARRSVTASKSASKVKEDESLAGVGGDGLEAVGDSDTEYYVRFNKNGGLGTQMTQQTFEWNVEGKLKECTYYRNGYDFVFWNEEKDGSGKEYRNQAKMLNETLSGNTLQLYAIWEPLEYTVSFSSNGGTGVMLDQAFLFDTPGTLSANQFKKDGYTFKSWNTKADGTGTSYPDNATSTNYGGTTGDGVILYAQWEMNDVKYTVNHYKQNLDGSYPSTPITETVTAQKGATSVLVNANSYEGFTCSGPTQQTITLSIDSSKNVANFYYTRNRYTITYANTDTDVSGTLPSPVTEVLYGDKITAATNSMSKKSTSEKLYITYHGNGGTVGTTGNSTYKQSKTVKVTYSPNGWELSGTPVTATAQSMKDSFAKLLGMTELSPVGATSYPSGGEIVCLGNMTLVPAFTSEQSGDTKVTFPDATRNRYVFKGWFTDSSIDLDVDDPVGKGGTKYDLEEDEEGIEDGDLYAGWKYDPNATTSTSTTSRSNTYYGTTTSRTGAAAATTTSRAAGSAAAAGGGAAGQAAVTAKKSTAKTKAGGEPALDSVPPTGEDAGLAPSDGVREAFLSLVDAVF